MIVHWLFNQKIAIILLNTEFNPAIQCPYMHSTSWIGCRIGLPNIWIEIGLSEGHDLADGLPRG